MEREPSGRGVLGGGPHVSLPDTTAAQSHRIAAVQAADTGAPGEAQRGNEKLIQGLIILIIRGFREKGRKEKPARVTTLNPD